MASPYAITTACHINPPSLDGNSFSAIEDRQISIEVRPTL
jgi:hypothetical protein